MSKLLINESPLTVLPSLVCAIGLNQAIVLQQIHYWLNIKRQKKEVDATGVAWVFNTYEQWQEQFPFWGIENIRKVFTALRNRGLLIAERRAPDPRDTTLSYTIDYDVLDQITAEWTGKNLPVGSGTGLPDGSGKKGPLVYMTETTTETTTKNSTSATEPPVANPGPAGSENSEQGNPEMANAKDVMDKFALKGIQAKGAAALVVRWKQHLHDLTGEFQGDLTAKEKGQLKQFGQKFGDQAISVLDYAVANWPEFALKAKSAAGLLTAPTQPHTGFLLAHWTVLIQMMSKPPKTIPGHPKSFDKPATVVHSSEKPTDDADKPLSEAEKTAAYEKAMAVLNGKK